MNGDGSIFSVLKSRMHWHQTRQKVLAENVANADTPKFRPRDLKDFALTVPQLTGTMAPVRTNVMHLNGAGDGRTFDSKRVKDFETRPSGNAVSLEDEMLKVADNQSQYQLAATLYSKSLGYLKTALGRRA